MNKTISDEYIYYYIVYMESDAGSDLERHTDQILRKMENNPLIDSIKLCNMADAFRGAIHEK